MSKHRLSKANQKCYFARFYLEAIENIGNDEAVINRKALLAAHQESCLFHLVNAYSGLVWEVANTYDLEFQNGVTVKEVLDSAQSRGVTLPELERFLNLETTPNSWLNRMLSSWMKVSALDPAVNAVEKETQNHNAIEVRVFTESDEFTQLSDWYDNLTALIEEIRTLLVEW